MPVIERYWLDDESVPFGTLLRYLQTYHHLEMFNDNFDELVAPARLSDPSDSGLATFKAELVRVLQGGLAGVDARLEQLYRGWADAYSYLSGPVDTVDAAGKLAAALHREQVHKSGEPYVEHVRGAAAIARANGAGTEQQIAALLHDTVEDTSCTLGQLGDLGVPGPVVEMVDALTRRSDESHDDYLTRLTRTPDAILVKRADIAHNSSPVRRSRLDSATQERLRRKYAHALQVLDESAASNG